MHPGEYFQSYLQPQTISRSVVFALASQFRGRPSIAEKQEITQITTLSTFRYDESNSLRLHIHHDFLFR